MGRSRLGALLLMLSAAIGAVGGMRSACAEPDQATQVVRAAEHHGDHAKETGECHHEHDGPSGDHQSACAAFVHCLTSGPVARRVDARTPLLATDLPRPRVESMPSGRALQPEPPPPRG
ncbi:MAG: hypothetical protein JNL26_00390 [Gemmatimonadetes bacterium]|nr:hypothetical protein [Gemmatimonadota bacterium]